MNSSYAALANQSASHSLQLDIYRPDGLLYKTFGTDTATGVGDFSSMPLSKALDKTQTSVTAILNVTLADRIVISRQMVGWRGVISSKSFNGTTTTTLQLYEGVVSSASVKGVYTSIELISKTGLLNSTPPLILANNCPRVFGSSSCGVVKVTVWAAVTTLSGSTLSLSPVAYTPNNSFKYQATVGDFSYVITGFGIPVAGQINSITLENVPLARPDFVLISTSCNQTFDQCRAYGNTRRFLGSVLPRSPLGIT